FRVDDTQRYGDVVVLHGVLEQGNPESLPSTLTAEVDVERRRAVMRNHTATHLLHWALHQVLGDHATQQGSLVAEDRLRFDLTHPKGITPDELDRIEAMVNQRIRENAILTTTVEDLDGAKARGVTALFGEKYDDEVRVVDIGGFSTELCGGTHCPATGDIGAFLITSESAVQAGVRRIEAVTGDRAVARFQADRRLLRETALALKTKPDDLPVRVDALQKQIKELKKSGGQRAANDAGGLVRELVAAATEVDGARIIVSRLAVAVTDLAGVADLLRNGHGSVCGLLVTEHDDKIGLVAFASKDLAGKRVHAGATVKAAAAMLGGGGGGRPDFAQAGGRDASRIDEALEAARSMLTKSLNG
ncbi:MAG: alanine--tRNA ligase, partial [Planctomycetes bacterium]|nr:alanine--tRNA ligase [Planctomycetota bacterium]